jgi:lipid-A-disaccharide synthase
MEQKNILIICGEASGEMRAAELVEELNKLSQNIKFFGIGSQLLQSKGVKILYDIKGLSVMGISDLFKRLPRFFALKKLLLKKINSLKFKAVILIDFSGFNLRLAKKINNAVPTIYYVSPQVWASRSGRIKILKKYIKKIVVLFKFEREFYAKNGIEVNWVGHPLIDTVKPTLPEKYLQESLKLAKEKTTIALFPGSRKQEVKRILPIMLKSATILKEELGAQFIIAKSSQVNWRDYNNPIKKFKLDIKIVEDSPYDCMNIADFCLVCSGTATLEAAIMEKPFVVIYKTTLLNYLLYRPLIKVPFIGIINIINNKKIIPEFIQFNAKPKRIAKSVTYILKNSDELKRMQSNLAKVKSSLGKPNAASRAAEAILPLLK